MLFGITYTNKSYMLFGIPCTQIHHTLFGIGSMLISWNWVMLDQNHLSVWGHSSTYADGIQERGYSVVQPYSWQDGPQNLRHMGSYDMNGSCECAHPNESVLQRWDHTAYMCTAVRVVSGEQSGLEGGGRICNRRGNCMVSPPCGSVCAHLE